ncbi:MAG: transcriptional regulator, partial [Candidatus Amulumruptor sp.]|nr:transcriptional regulator [Candidatus Amulumruptor sp.]
TETPVYYKPGEITEAMYGRQVRIIGGLLNNYSGRLLSVKGMRTRRLIVEIPALITAAVEVEPEFIQFV